MEFHKWESEHKKRTMRRSTLSDVMFRKYWLSMNSMMNLQHFGEPALGFHQLDVIFFVSFRTICLRKFGTTRLFKKNQRLRTRLFRLHTDCVHISIQFRACKMNNGTLVASYWIPISSHCIVSFATVPHSFTWSFLLQLNSRSLPQTRAATKAMALFWQNNYLFQKSRIRLIFGMVAHHPW